MKRKYFSKNHAKFLIKYHFIFVVKYRKPLLNNEICKLLSDYFSNNFSNFSIDFLGFDEDHLHIMVNSEPTISPTQIARKLKQESTYYIWKNVNLSNHFWKEKTFWTDGYFVCSCGDVSTEIVEKYIQNQGGNSSHKLKT